MIKKTLWFPAIPWCIPGLSVCTGVAGWLHSSQSRHRSIITNLTGLWLQANNSPPAISSCQTQTQLWCLHLITMTGPANTNSVKLHFICLFWISCLEVQEIFAFQHMGRQGERWSFDISGANYGRQQRQSCWAERLIVIWHSPMSWHMITQTQQI